ncbi:Synaptotagmin-like protein 2 [Labeo rohita]|uniref:Synaptotagmin-like protein 2 n=1 Tax=Labeo rohita TaxID=84645 RepID=A0ABQ8LU96_LABRO|nr:Synaptotagmin-like protein 2 [Labeo rohita]
MKQAKSTFELIDLSFLSAEEEAAIRHVLLRDEDLRRLESGRVRKLRQSVPDLHQLRTLTGEWFEELKVRRYGEQTDVTAVVRSSMRWKKTAEASSFPRVAARKEKLKAEVNGNHVLSGTDPQRSSSETQPKELFGDQITTVFPFLSAAQDTKPERGTPKHAPNPEPRRKVSLPPALRKDQSFEENWVKISLEPNAVKPVHDESNSVGPQQKEVKSHFETTETLKKQDTPSPNTEPPSLTFTDQTSLQTVSHTEPEEFNQDVFLEICSSTEFHNQPQTSLVFTSGGPKLTNDSDDESTNAFQGRDQQRSVECTLRESESDKLSPSDSANEHDKRTTVSGDDLNDEASSDRKGGEGKNVSTGLLAETDTDQAESVAGVEQINSSAEKASRSQSLKWGIEMDSYEFSSDTLQGKAAQSDSDDVQPVEMEKKTPNKNEQSSVSDNTVQRYLDAYEDKEKKSSNDWNLPEDATKTSQVLAELSQDYLSMTDDGKLVHVGNTGVQVNTNIINKTAAESIQPAKPTSEDVPGLGQGSSEMKDEKDSETEQKTKPDILLSALGRAQKARPPVLPNITVQETRDNTVPTIVIMPSESPGPTEIKGQKHGVSDIEALLKGSTSKTPSYTADTWEDEGVDSDDDDTSLSSYGSDLSSRKGYSASALSLTDHLLMTQRAVVLQRGAGSSTDCVISQSHIPLSLPPFPVIIHFPIQRTGSSLSVYSDAGDFGNVEVQGSVEFAVMYSPVGELIIMIEQCQDLAIANPRKQRTDPYVKTYLYPDKSRRSKRKTSIKKRTVNPVYVESLRYKVKHEELPDKILNLSVWHNDSRGRNVFLGQVEISFKTWDWGHEALTWYNLQPKTSENQESQESNGLFSVSLKYVPPESGGSKNSTGEIHVWLREAKELRRLKPQGVDSFVKCYILPDTRKKSRQKTRIVKKTQDPVYNHAMVYDGFKTGEVSEACCELTVWDHNTLTNQFLGGLRLSLGTGQSYGKKVDWMDSMEEEIQIWKRMLANPNSWVEGELPLRSSMTPRK